MRLQILTSVLSTTDYENLGLNFIKQIKKQNIYMYQTANDYSIFTCEYDKYGIQVLLLYL